MKNLFIVFVLTITALLFSDDVKAQQDDNTPKLGNSSAKIVNENTSSSQTTEKKKVSKLSLAEAKKGTELMQSKKQNTPDSNSKKNAPKLGTMSKKEEK